MDRTDTDSDKAIESFARWGYLAKGVIYSAIGVLAGLAAFGMGGETTDTQGAIRQIAAQPFGSALVLFMTAGLAGHVLWRLVQAWKDPEHRGSGPGGLASRLGLMISAAVYAALAVYAVDLLVGILSSGGSSAEDRTAQLMALPFGLWLVGAAGISFLGVGLYHLYRGYHQGFREHWDHQAMSPSQAKWAARIASAGLASRAVVFLIVGVLLIIAAVQADPEEAAGLGGALQALAQQPYGIVLLSAVAAGMVCYGIYCFVNARFRHVNP